MSLLDKKNIVLVFSGSVGIVRAVEFIRFLRKKNANVFCVVTPSAKQFVGVKALEWASKNRVFDCVSANCDYLEFAGFKGKADLIVFFATANSIAKMCVGISDNIALLFASTALGSGKPLLVVPLGHLELFENTAMIENFEMLSEMDCEVFCFQEEGAFKFPVFEWLLLECERVLGKPLLAGKKVVVASGPVMQKIDSVRAIKNISSGETGRQLCFQAYRLGAEVVHITSVKTGFPGIVEEECLFAKEFEEKVLLALRDADLFFCPAALPDFEVEEASGKLSSSKKKALVLKPRKKLLERIRKLFPDLKICAFKLEVSNQKKLEEDCLKLKKGFNCSLVVGNLLKNVKKKNTKCVVFSEKKEFFSGSKKVLAEKLFSLLS